MSVGRRIKEIRQSESLSMEAFGKRLSMVKSNVSRMENEHIEISDRNIKLICNEFNINEDWLKYGKGDMYKSLNSNDIDANYMSLLGRVAAVKDPVTRRMLENFEKLSDKNRAMILELVEHFLEIDKKKDSE